MAPLTARDRLDVRIEVLRELDVLAPGNRHVAGMLAGLLLCRRDLLDAREAEDQGRHAEVAARSEKTVVLLGPARAETPPPPPGACRYGPKIDAAPAGEPPRVVTVVAPPPPPGPVGKKPHWTQFESPEARSARMAKMQEARWGRLSPAPRGPLAPPPAAPLAPSACAAEGQAEALAGPDTAMGAAIASAMSKNERAMALLRDGADLDEHDIAASVGLPLREVYRLKALVREEGRRTP